MNAPVDVLAVTADTLRGPKGHEAHDALEALFAAVEQVLLYGTDRTDGPGRRLAAAFARCKGGAA